MDTIFESDGETTSLEPTTDTSTSSKAERRQGGLFSIMNRPHPFSASRSSQPDTRYFMSGGRDGADTSTRHTDLSGPSITHTADGIFASGAKRSPLRDQTEETEVFYWPLSKRSKKRECRDTSLASSIVPISSCRAEESAAPPSTSRQRSRSPLPVSCPDRRSRGSNSRSTSQRQSTSPRQSTSQNSLVPPPSLANRRFIKRATPSASLVVTAPLAVKSAASSSSLIITAPLAVNGVLTAHGERTEAYLTARSDRRDADLAAQSESRKADTAFDRLYSLNSNALDPAPPSAPSKSHRSRFKSFFKSSSARSLVKTDAYTPLEEGYEYTLPNTWSAADSACNRDTGYRPRRRICAPASTARRGFRSRLFGSRKSEHGVIKPGTETTDVSAAAPTQGTATTPDSSSANPDRSLVTSPPLSLSPAAGTEPPSDNISWIVNSTADTAKGAASWVASTAKTYGTLALSAAWTGTCAGAGWAGGQISAYWNGPGEAAPPLGGEVDESEDEESGVDEQEDGAEDAGSREGGDEEVRPV